MTEQTLVEKLKNAERAIELYKSMWNDACTWANVDDIPVCWPEEIQELLKLGYERNNYEC